MLVIDTIVLGLLAYGVVLFLHYQENEKSDENRSTATEVHVGHPNAYKKSSAA